MKRPRTTTPAVLVLIILAGCVPRKVHEERIAADRARMAEQAAHINELNSQVEAVSATRRILEGVCIANGLLLAACLATLWRRAHARGRS